MKRRMTDPPGFQIVNKMVGAEGFEPSAFWSRTKRATRLRYAPKSVLMVDREGLEPPT